MHTGPVEKILYPRKPFSCPKECGKSFSHRIAMKKHGEKCCPNKTIGVGNNNTEIVVEDAEEVHMQLSDRIHSPCYVIV